MKCRVNTLFRSKNKPDQQIEKFHEQSPIRNLQAHEHVAAVALLESILLELGPHFLHGHALRHITALLIVLPHLAPLELVQAPQPRAIHTHTSGEGRLPSAAEHRTHARTRHEIASPQSLTSNARGLVSTPENNRSRTQQSSHTEIASPPAIRDTETRHNRNPRGKVSQDGSIGNAFLIVRGNWRPVPPCPARHSARPRARNATPAETKTYRDNEPPRQARPDACSLASSLSRDNSAAHPSPASFKTLGTLNPRKSDGGGLDDGKGSDDEGGFGTVIK